jgi:signal transduction histidine kinase
VHRLRLSVKLPLLVVLAVLTTAAVGAGAAVGIGRSVLRQAELENNAQRVKVYASAIHFYLDGARATLETTAGLPRIEAFAGSSLGSPARPVSAADEEAVRRRARLVLEHSKVFEYIMLLRADGSVYLLEPRALEAKLSHSDLSFRSWYQDLLHTRKTVISDLVISPVTQAPSVVIATPIHSASGRLVGIWAGALKLEELSRIGSAASGSGPPAQYGYLTDRRGLIIAHQARRYYVENQTDFRSVPAVRAALSGRQGEEQFVNPIEGEEEFGAYMPLPDLGWAAVYATSLQVAFAPLERLTRGIVLSTLVLAVFMGAVGILVARRVAGPIRELSAAARTIGTGEFSQRIEVRSGDEVGQLGEEFNRMAAALAESQSRLTAHAQELEVTVQQRSKALRALEDANRELEAFSYSVSHDLRAPLRAIDGFSRILMEQCAPELSPEAQRHLGIVSDSTRQMGRLVDDLLAFSRLSRQPLKTQRVAPAELVQQSLAELQPAQAGRRMKITVAPLPECDADPRLLKQVFLNLIDNALKFTRRRQVAEIEIGCQVISGENAYFVKDNGTGFDMTYAHKLFGVFQRLHRSDEYEGTGVGLAIVQRIVQRHGGLAWAEAAPDQGATFYFTLEGGHRHGTRSS